jgi:hypothetical protein
MSPLPSLKVRQRRTDIANQVLFHRALSKTNTTNNLRSCSGSVSNHSDAINSKDESSSERAGGRGANNTARWPRIAIGQSDLVCSPSCCTFDAFQNDVSGESISNDDLCPAATSDIETFDRACIIQAPSGENLLKVCVCFNAQLVTFARFRTDGQEPNSRITDTNCSCEGVTS